MNVYCNALLADLTDIKLKFTETKQMAEHEFVEALKNHYIRVKEKLTRDLTEIEREITIEACKLTGPELESHTSLMKKTEDNVTKLVKELNERKKRKMEGLARPTNSDRRDRRRKPYMTQNPHTNPPPNPRARETYQKGNSRPCTNNRPAQSMAYNAQVNNPTIPMNSHGMHTIAPGANTTKVYNTAPPPQAPTQSIDLASLAGLFNQLLRQNQPATIQQPPTLLNHPCAPGLQPPMLSAPGVNPQSGLPPCSLD